MNIQKLVIHNLVLLCISLILLTPGSAIGAEAENEDQIAYELGLRHGIGWMYVGPSNVKAPYASPDEERTVFLRHKATMMGLAIDGFSLSKSKRSNGSDAPGNYKYGFEFKNLSGTAVLVSMDYGFFRKFYIGIGLGGFVGKVVHQKKFSNFSENTQLVTIDDSDNARGVKLDPNIRFQIMRGVIGMDVRVNSPVYLIVKAPDRVERTWVSYPLPTFAVYWRF